MCGSFTPNTLECRIFGGRVEYITLAQADQRDVAELPLDTKRPLRQSGNQYMAPSEDIEAVTVHSPASDAIAE
jgi:hypothetical protein